MCSIRIAFVAALIPLSIPTGGTADLVERCAAGIEAIRSYDVTFALERFYYPKTPEGTKAGNTATVPVPIARPEVRDVLAFGLGRHMEENRGAPDRIISVIDWQTARSGSKPLSTTIARKLDGNGYLDFFNPDCWGFFLADLLRDGQSTTRMLEATSSSRGLIGFEVTHPEMTRPVRVWADPDHGHMPSIIEKHVQDEEGNVLLWKRIEVSEFAPLEDGAWVPVNGTCLSFANRGEQGRVAVTGTSLVVDVEQSSWNSISSGELFAASSLPEANYVTDSGYRQYLPPAGLAAVERSDRMREEAAAARTLPERKFSRLVPFVASIVALVVLITVLARRARRGRQVATRGQQSFASIHSGPRGATSGSCMAIETL